MSVSKFPAGAQVCCFGDSITRNGDWIETLLCFYAEQNPYSAVQLFNCGISGGGMHTVLDHLSEDLKYYHPTHAIIMAGMNDIHRELYLPDSTMDPRRKLRLRQQALDNYRENMKDILCRLQEDGIHVILLSPTPYDEQQISDQPCMAGCDGALEICARICRDMARQYGCEYLDMHSLFHATMITGSSGIIEGDRIHPTAAGQQLFAELFLKAQGFDVSTMYLQIKQSAVQQTRRQTERILRNLADAQLLVFDAMEPLSLKEKQQVARRYLNGSMPYYGYYESYYMEILTDYTQHIFRKEELLSEYIQLTNQFATQGGSV